MSDSTGNTPGNPLPPTLSAIARNLERRRGTETEAHAAVRRRGEFDCEKNALTARWGGEWDRLNAEITPVFTGETPNASAIATALLGIGRVIVALDHLLYPAGSPPQTPRSVRRQTTIGDRLTQAAGETNQVFQPPWLNPVTLLSAATNVATTEEQLTQSVTIVLENDAISFGWFGIVRDILEHPNRPPDNSVLRLPHGRERAESQDVQDETWHLYVALRENDRITGPPPEAPLIASATTSPVVDPIHQIDTPPVAVPPPKKPDHQLTLDPPMTLLWGNLPIELTKSEGQVWCVLQIMVPKYPNGKIRIEGFSNDWPNPLNQKTLVNTVKARLTEANQFLSRLAGMGQKLKVVSDPVHGGWVCWVKKDSADDCND